MLDWIHKGFVHADIKPNNMLHNHEIVIIDLETVWHISTPDNNEDPGTAGFHLIMELVYETPRDAYAVGVTIKEWCDDAGIVMDGQEAPDHPRCLGAPILLHCREEKKRPAEAQERDRGAQDEQQEASYRGLNRFQHEIAAEGGR